MSDSQNTVFPLVLIGPMGAGKSRVGRRVARELDVPFVDTDRSLETEYGPIAEIFAREGEDYFRVLERETVSSALQEEAVVSVGGGAVLDQQTQADLAACTVVYLTVSQEAVAKRIISSDRPLLMNGTAGGGLEAWRRIYNERRPLYEALCNTSINTSGRSVKSIATDIVTWLKENRGND